jgi:hypothetical protein
MDCSALQLSIVNSPTPALEADDVGVMQEAVVGGGQAGDLGIWRLMPPSWLAGTRASNDWIDRGVRRVVSHGCCSCGVVSPVQPPVE